MSTESNHKIRISILAVAAIIIGSFRLRPIGFNSNVRRYAGTARDGSRGVTIGVVASLSGQYTASYGQTILHGFELAQNEINSAHDGPGGELHYAHPCRRYGYIGGCKSGIQQTD